MTWSPGIQRMSQMEGNLASAKLTQHRCKRTSAKMSASCTTTVDVGQGNRDSAPTALWNKGNERRTNKEILVSKLGCRNGSKTEMLQRLDS